MGIKARQDQVVDQYRKDIIRYKNYVCEDGRIMFNIYMDKVVELTKEAAESAEQKNIDFIKVKVQPVLNDVRDDYAQTLLKLCPHTGFFATRSCSGWFVKSVRGQAEKKLRQKEQNLRQASKALIGG